MKLMLSFLSKAVITIVMKTPIAIAVAIAMATTTGIVVRTIVRAIIAVLIKLSKVFKVVEIIIGIFINQNSKYAAKLIVVCPPSLVY